MTTPTPQPTADDAGEDAFPTLEKLRKLANDEENPSLVWTKHFVALAEENLRLRKALRRAVRYGHYNESEQEQEEIYQATLNNEGISPVPLVQSEATASRAPGECGAGGG